ncbi:MAG: CapA family protein [Thomasclavelia ramosa]
MRVDVIIGHHSHCIQPIEWLETTNHKTLVVYSLRIIYFS